MQRCLHCLREQTKDRSDLPFGIFKKVLKQAEKYNNPYIALTGGEPTLHKDFFRILKHLSDSKFEFHFVTNGFNFSSIHKRILPFVGNGLTRVCFSLDGAKEATHDKIRVKGSFRRTLEAVAICKAKKIPVSVQMVVNKFNRNEIKDMAYLASKMEFDELFFSHMHTTFGNATFDIQLSPDEWLKTEEEVNELKKAFRVPITLSAGYFDETPVAHCQFLQGGAMNIDFKGNLTFCCQISGMFDSSKKEDIICNLGTTSLFKAHKMLIDRVAEINKRRVDAIEKGKLSKLDFFHCWFCFKEFKKIDWLKFLKNNEWAKKDPYFGALTRDKWEKPSQIQN
jgi:MoaA/NifB/PqqE/SkfB family radical SAM enzyme